MEKPEVILKVTFSLSENIKYNILSLVKMNFFHIFLYFITLYTIKVAYLIKLICVCSGVSCSLVIPDINGPVVGGKIAFIFHHYELSLHKI